MIQLTPQEGGKMRSKSALVARWAADCDHIGVEITVLWTRWEHTRGLERAFSESREASAHPSGFYIPFSIVPGILESILAGLRRLADRDHRTRSFRNFLVSLSRQPTAFSLANCKQIFADRARRVFGDDSRVSTYEQEAALAYAEIADNSRANIDAQIVQRDVVMLENLCAKAKEVTDKYVAHSDRVRPDVNIQLHEIDSTLRQVWDLTRKYTRLFDGGAHGGVKFNWSEVRTLYTFPWLEP